MLDLLMSLSVEHAVECGKRLIIYTMQLIDFDMECDKQVHLDKNIETLL